MATLHPRPDDRGRPVVIRDTHLPSDPSTWAEPEAVATFVPNGDVPGDLKGIPLAPWADTPQSFEQWASVLGQRPGLIEPPLPSASGKHLAAAFLTAKVDAPLLAKLGALAAAK